jgi:hypothetical protein
VAHLSAKNFCSKYLLPWRGARRRALARVTVCISPSAFRRRREAAVKLIESGMSRRQAAKVLGVNVSTVSRDLSQDATGSVAKSNTGSAKTKAHRAAVSARASSKGRHAGDFGF